MRSQLVVVPALVAIAAACWLSVSCRDDELSERPLCAPVRRLAPRKVARNHNLSASQCLAPPRDAPLINGTPWSRRIVKH